MTLDATGYGRVKQAFLELATLDAAQRTARLAALAREDSALADAVRAQLAAAERPSALLDRHESPAMGPRVPGYRVIRELGRGGMGIVWLAERELDDARQLVALKQIARASWDADDRRRFQRERRILATLDHPNIAALVDGGSDDAGHAWLATQYVDGERIDRWCDAQGLGTRARVLLMRQVAAAVAHAHARLVVHRDLKPANILVTHDGVPKLLDFGIARHLEEEALTGTGDGRMTLRYAAPEQVASDGSEAGTSIDVHALGALLYELVAARAPFGDATETAALVHAILHVDPAPPSRTGTVRTGVDADLDAICLKALRKRPAERYASASALVADLDRWLEREPVEARRGERGYRLRRALRRNRAWIAAAVVLVAAVGYHLVAQQRQLELLERQRDKAQALADQFGQLFREARPADTERGDVSARELLERSVATLVADQSRPAATRATLLVASATALDFLGHVQPALDASRAALPLALAAQPRDSDVIAAAHSELAGMLHKTGDVEGAQREAASALALFDAGEARDRSQHLTVQQQAAMFAESAGDVEGAKRGYERVAEIALADLGERRAMESYLAAQTNIATSEKKADPAAAERRLRDALAMADAHGYVDPKTLLPMRTYLAGAMSDQRRIQPARELMQQVEREARTYFASGDPWFGLILSVAGNVAVLDGDPRRGAELLSESHAIAAAAQGADHPNATASEGDRALAAVVANDWPDASARLDVVIERLERTGRGDGPQATHLRAARAYVRSREAPGDAALRAALREALAANERWSNRLRWIAEPWQAWADAKPP